MKLGSPAAMSKEPPSGPADARSVGLSVEDLEDENARLEAEFRRWQDAIRDLCLERCPGASIDGAGCDSGDPLDLTLAEVGQVIAHWEDQWQALSEPSTIRKAAEAIANARIMRRGSPAIANVWDILPEKLRDEVTEDATAALAAFLKFSKSE